MNQKQTEALLFVARETSMITIAEAAERVLSDAGFTADEIASITGKTPKTKKAAPKTPAKKTARRRQNAWSRWTTEDDNTIESLWADGKTVTQIAKSMKRSTPSVNARITLLRATGSKIEYRNLGARDARLNGSTKTAKFSLPKK
jgi:DNA-binding NarL/FixJ family response regulator